MKVNDLSNTIVATATLVLSVVVFFMDQRRRRTEHRNKEQHDKKELFPKWGNICFATCSIATKRPNGLRNYLYDDSTDGSERDDTQVFIVYLHFAANPIPTTLRYCVRRVTVEISGESFTYTNARQQEEGIVIQPGGQYVIGFCLQLLNKKSYAQYYAALNYPESQNPYYRKIILTLDFNFSVNVDYKDKAKPLTKQRKTTILIANIDDGKDKDTMERKYKVEEVKHG